MQDMKIYKCTFYFFNDFREDPRSVTITAVSIISLLRCFIKETKGVFAYKVIRTHKEELIRKEVWKECIKNLEIIELPLIEK